MNRSATSVHSSGLPCSASFHTPVETSSWPGAEIRGASASASTISCVPHPPSARHTSPAPRWACRRAWPEEEQAMERGLRRQRKDRAKVVDHDHLQLFCAGGECAMLVHHCVQVRGQRVALEHAMHERCRTGIHRRTRAWCMRRFSLRMAARVSVWSCWVSCIHASGSPLSHASMLQPADAAPRTPCTASSTPHTVRSGSRACHEAARRGGGQRKCAAGGRAHDADAEGEEHVQASVRSCSRDGHRGIAERWTSAVRREARWSREGASLLLTSDCS